MHDQASRIKLLVQACHQIAIKFDHMQLPHTFQQEARHCSKAGSDLDHGIVCFRFNDANDVVQDTLISQKILTKAFSWNMFHDFTAAIWAAVRMAASMLP